MDRPDDLVALRRDLHRHPEPAWCEFYTTARLREAVDGLADAVVLGPDLLDAEARLGVPDDATIAEWADRAVEAGADPAVVDRLDGGLTGLLATVEGGDGPTVALRVDVDGLPVEEAHGPDHRPAAEGFRSQTGAMHACGHDAHATFGVGVLGALAEDFPGTLKVLFQPAEEVVGGAKPVVEGGHLDDVDYLLAVHVGLGHPTGSVVAGVDGFLAVDHFRATFTGESAHAGVEPEVGRDAIRALATATTGLYALPRHGDGATRVNVGVVEGGTAANIVASEATLEAEVRGETTPLMESMRDRAADVLAGAAQAEGCDLDLETVGRAPSAESDSRLSRHATKAAGEVTGVERVLESAGLGGSEDATYLMRHVTERGGRAAYLGVGSDTPSGHHTATFDVDEAAIPIGVDWLAATSRAIAAEQP